MRLGTLNHKLEVKRLWWNYLSFNCLYIYMKVLVTVYVATYRYDKQTKRVVIRVLKILFCLWIERLVHYCDSHVLDSSSHQYNLVQLLYMVQISLLLFRLCHGHGKLGQIPHWFLVLSPQESPPSRANYQALLKQCFILHKLKHIICSLHCRRITHSKSVLLDTDLYSQPPYKSLDVHTQLVLIVKLLVKSN